MNPPAPVVAIDGPAGSGKGTVAAEVAARLGWRTLDSGALYRAVALATLRRGLDPAEAAGVADLARRLTVRFADGRVHVDGQDETCDIRQPSVDAAASRVAALPAVRRALLEIQRGFRQPPGLVAEGRDMGTVVFPDARLKVFLTASAGVRAKRRFRQLRGREPKAPQLKPERTSVSLRALREAIEERDRRDRKRAASPLVPARDAVAIDSTALSVGEVVDAVAALARERGLAAERG